MNRMRRAWLLAPGLAFTLLVGPAILIHAQSQPSSEVGIDEKLGAEAALDVNLKDEAGRSVTLRELIEKPTILTLNYFRCIGICSPQLNGVVDVINRTTLEGGQDFQVITVSFDPRDTPEAARSRRIDYLKQIKRPFPPRAWRFLTGEAQATRQLADSVGYYFRSDADMYKHPGTIIMLTPSGVVSRYLYGINFLPADIEMAVQDAAREQVRPTISKFLDFCYSYEPGSRKSVFQMTRVIGAVFLCFAGLFVGILLKGKLGGKQGK